MSDRRLIEEALPLKEVSTEAAREKSIRHGHISTLHIWWARRPLVACRAAVLGSLLRDPGNKEERKKILNFLTKFCTWEASNDPALVNEARCLVLEGNGGKPLKVLDSFAGGGAIPLEVLRVGSEAYALELNPVATLIELCTLVYPQKYGQPIEVSSEQSNLQGENRRVIANRLAYDVERWGKWTFEEAKKELQKFYPMDPNGDEPLAYFWMRTLKCPSPKCGAVIPLFRQLWLAKSKNRRIALKPIVDKGRNEVSFRVTEGTDIDFDPSQRTVKRATVNCLVCSSPMTAYQTKTEAKSGRMGQRLVAVATYRGDGEKKTYRTAKESDRAIFDAAKETLKQLSQPASSLPLVPNEKMPPIGTYGIDAQRYTVDETWGELFNARQLLALVTLCSKVKKVYKQVLNESGDPEYAKAVTTYLALAIDRCANQNSAQCVWVVNGEKVAGSFGRQAVPTVWDYVEPNIIGENSWSWLAHVGWIIKVIEQCSSIPSMSADVRQGTATRLPYPDEYFDAAITDPPYYNAVPYSDLSDFFYVWLKRSVGHLYPDLFATPLTPKLAEIIQNPVFKVDSGTKDKEFFEREMTKALRELNRALRPNGICAIVFAHKTTTAWETLIAALLNAGFTVTSSWPMRTERPGRLRAQESAALASSVWLVCRKRKPDAGVGSWKSVQAELDARVKERLDYFLSQGIKGADALLSAIGPALEVFGRYEKVEKVTGDAVTIVEFLDKVREVVAYHALSTVLSEQELGKVEPLTAFYVLWKWTFEPIVQMTQAPIEGENEETGKKTSNGPKTLIPFDDALKLARSVGAEIETLLKARLLKQEKEYVRMLNPTDRKDIHALGETARDGTPPTIIDMVHRALILWASQEYGKLDEYLQTSGAVTNETFWRVAQALSNLLQLQSREKQLLDGLLARHAAGVSDTGRQREDKTLDEFMMKEKVK